MCDNIEIPVVADYTNGKHSQIYTVVYMSCGVIAHIIRYTGKIILLYGYQM